MEVPLSVLGAWRSSSQSHCNLSFLGCCCEPTCERQADTILYKEFRQQFELLSVVPIFLTDCYRKNLLFPLASFMDIECEHG